MKTILFLTEDFSGFYQKLLGATYQVLTIINNKVTYDFLTKPASAVTVAMSNLDIHNVHELSRLFFRS